MLIEVAGKVAVITGAASGFGLAMAKHFRKEGMKLVLADIDTEGLQQAKNSLKEPENEVLTVLTDVADPAAVQALAAAAFNHFGAVHLLINNAGVSSVGPVWETKPEEWKRVFDINFFGIVNGLDAFLSRMMQQPFPSHIVNTASAAGLLSPPGLSVYTATKHAAVALTETLYADLALAQSQVGVSLLCPAWVKTGIAGKGDPQALLRMSPFTRRVAVSVAKALESATVSADEVAAATLKAVQEGTFYILTHPEVKEEFMRRAQRIVNEQPPTVAEIKI